MGTYLIFVSATLCATGLMFAIRAAQILRGAKVLIDVSLENLNEATNRIAEVEEARDVATRYAHDLRTELDCLNEALHEARGTKGEA